MMLTWDIICYSIHYFAASVKILEAFGTLLFNYFSNGANSKIMMYGGVPHIPGNHIRKVLYCAIWMRCKEDLAALPPHRRSIEEDGSKNCLTEQYFVIYPHLTRVQEVDKVVMCFVKFCEGLDLVSFIYLFI